MKYILIIVILNSGYPVDVRHVEFDSRKSCETAMKELDRPNLSVDCYRK